MNPPINSCHLVHAEADTRPCNGQPNEDSKVGKRELSCKGKAVWWSKCSIHESSGTPKWRKE